MSAEAGGLAGQKAKVLGLFAPLRLVPLLSLASCFIPTAPNMFAQALLAVAAASAVVAQDDFVPLAAKRFEWNSLVSRARACIACFSRIV